MLWLLADLLLHSTLILLATELVCLVARRMSPAARHHIRLLSLALVLLWPFMTLVVPQWHLSFRHAGSSNVTIDTVALQGRIGSQTQSILPWPFLLWLAGFAVWSAYFATGYGLVSRIARRAVGLDDAEWTSMLTTLTEETGVRAKPRLLKADG